MVIGDSRARLTVHRRALLQSSSYNSTQRLMPAESGFGAVVKQVDINESIGVYTAALQKAGNQDVTIKVFPEADHCLFVSQTGGLKEMRRMWEAPVKVFVPGYLDTIAEWVRDRFV